MTGGQAITDRATTGLWTVADTQQTVPHRFAEVLARQPSKTAIAGTDWQPTFEDLAEAASGIAAELAARNGGEPGRVALLMDHDAPLIAAMLGVLEAGQAIVVLNPKDPPGRLDRIRQQVDPWVALIDGRHRNLARNAGFDPVIEASEARSDRGHPPGMSHHQDRLAAVSYTSGSTGQPKGVMHTHHTLLHTAFRHSTGLGLRPDDRIALLASPSGGHGMGTTWMTLLTGATLCPYPVMDRGVAGLPDWLREHRISVLGLSASLYRRLVGSLEGDVFPDLRLVRLGSEQVQRSDLDACRRQLGHACQFANVFSLTEAGGLAHCLFAAGEEPHPGPLPVGNPAAGVEILLLDERGEPVSPGAPGEIFVRSRHLFPGYWRNDALTAERFSSGSVGGDRMLRTGDLGRLDEDGRLVVIGRADAQVKIRGYRVELPEVESALRALPDVEAAAVRAEPTRHGDGRLTAYVVSRGGVRPAPAELRDALRATLSEASIPTAFIFVNELPLNAHGKVDRERLAGLTQADSPASTEFAEPVGQLELKLSRIWAEALELKRVGRNDNFFDVGGDSLAAAEIGAGAYEIFGVELDMRAFARHPTVAGLAQLVERLQDRRTGEPAQLRAVPRDKPLPCTFTQERIWRLLDTANYSVASVTGLHGPIDLEALRAALQQVAARHEPLRTTFAERDGQPVQVIHSSMPLQLPLTDIGGTTDPDQDVIRVLQREAADPFDLEHGPLLRLRLVRVSDSDHRLLRVSHHLITDRASWRIFFAELIPIYEALVNGKPPPTTRPARLQYADYATWERGRLRPDGPLYREQVRWWRHTLGDPPPLQLPFARSSPAVGASPDDGNIWWGIDPAMTEALDRVGREAGATHYTVRLALFSALLALDLAQEEITVGAYVDTRRLPETRTMFGYFTNLVTLVLPFDPRAPLRSWLRRAGSALIEAIARGELPYERLCDELRASGRVPPEVHAIFSVRTPLPERPWLSAEQIPKVQGRITMPWGFNFTVDQADESNGCHASFDARIHDPAAVRRFIDRYAALAEAAGTRPDHPLGDLHAAL